MSVLSVSFGIRCATPQRVIQTSLLPSQKLISCSSCAQLSLNSENGGSLSVSTEKSSKKRKNKVSPPVSSNGENMKLLMDRFKYVTAIGIGVPNKISELNKLISRQSKFVSSKLPLKLQSGNEERKETFNEKKSNRINDFHISSTQSLEHSIVETNESIASFYDTSCVSSTLISQPTSDMKAFPSAYLSKDDEIDWQESQTIGPLFPMKQKEDEKKKTEKRKAEKISRLSLERRTKSLVLGLKTSHSLMSKITRCEDLCEHLIANPDCVWDTTSEDVVPYLKHLSQNPDRLLRGLANQALALLGYVKPLTSPGIRLLSIDGGGTRALVTIEFLKALEKATGKKCYELFDYVCGVSTGALLGTMICGFKLPLDRCEALYKEYSVKMFTRNRVVGTTKLVWKHGFYDSKCWEDTLKKELGERLFSDLSRDPTVPRLSAVSSLVSASSITNHLFRTYNHPPGAASMYPGSCKHQMWEVIRASTAAPGYFESYTSGDDVHEDGGTLSNNPTALAIHESRLLWPNENFHSVVSLGTGRYFRDGTQTKYSLSKRISTFVDSATDTEAVHKTLQDLLPSHSYFRFNPYLSEEFQLNEIRLEKMEQMQEDAQMYLRRNSFKLKAAAERLLEGRKHHQVASDFAKGLIKRIL